MNLLSIDLNTARFNSQNYLNLIGSTNCTDLDIHIYNYIEQKHNKLPFCHGEILHKYLGSRKKVALDIKQAVDIVELCAKNNYQQVFVLCGEYESESLFFKLNEMNVKYNKISPASFRQTELKFEEFAISETEPIKQPNAENKIIPFEVLPQIESDNKLQEKEQLTKLTPEQIKKIYNYIKFKQIENKIKSM